MKLKTVMSMVGVAALAWQIDAAPSVEITGVQQQYPWTNTVDISYNVTGVTNKEYFAVFEARHEGRLLGAVTNELDGTGQAASAVQSLTTQWFPDFDLKKTGVTMTPYIYRGGVGAGADYLIINLETWKVTYEGMVTQEDSNRKYNTDEYKTKYMVFRRIMNGTYTIGHSLNRAYGGANGVHTVTVPEPYYIAIFEMTQGQYNRINSGSKTGQAYLQAISWNTARGSAGVLAKPTTGPLYTMSNKTRLCIDLPTHAMFEVAIRAGSTLHCMSGNTSSDVQRDTAYKHYSGETVNGQSFNGTVAQTTKLGLKRPNAWGIYNPFGFGENWMRDMYNSSGITAMENTFPNVFVPISTGDSSYRLYSYTIHSWSVGDNDNTFSSFNKGAPSASSWYNCIRPAVYPTRYYPTGR